VNQYGSVCFMRKSYFHVQTTLRVFSFILVICVTRTFRKNVAAVEVVDRLVAVIVVITVWNAEKMYHTSLLRLRNVVTMFRDSITLSKPPGLWGSLEGNVSKDVAPNSPQILSPVHERSINDLISQEVIDLVQSESLALHDIFEGGSLCII